MGHHVVDLIGLVGALARADGGLELAAGVGGVDHLEQHMRIVLRRLLGLRAQPGGLGHPDVPDLAAAAVIDQYADRVRPVAVAEGHGQRLLAAADVRVVPALTDLRGTERGGPRRVGHTASRYPGRRLPGGGPQGRRADHREDPQQGEGFRRGRRLRGGNQRSGQGVHERGLTRGRGGQRADQVRAPQFGVHRVIQLAEDAGRLGQHAREGVLHRHGGENPGHIGICLVFIRAHAVQDRASDRERAGSAPGSAPGSAQSSRGAGP